MKKKKKVLKSWVEKTLVITNLIMVIIMASECKNFTVFLISHIVAFVIFVANSIILINYGKDWY